MRVVEVSGKTVDEAVARALARLGLKLEQVDVDVIREGKKGLFGLGSEDAIVRVSAKANVVTTPASARPPRGGQQRGGGAGAASQGGGDRGRDRSGRSERGDQYRDRSPGQAGTQTGGQVSGSGGRGERGPRPDHDQDRGATRGPERANGTSPTIDERATQDGGERTDSRPRRRGRGGGRGSGSGSSQTGQGTRSAEGAPDITISDVPPGTAGLPTAPPADVDDPVEFGGRTLRDVLTLLGLTETEIAARAPETAGDGDGLVAQVFDIYGRDTDSSDELGALIGRRGETLQALQYLLNVMASSRYGNDQVFGIDIEGYRRRREQSLVEMARRVAQEVRDTGDVITLEPMPAAERRIVHLALQEEPGVRTESVGQGVNRQVEVMPADLDD